MAERLILVQEAGGSSPPPPAIPLSLTRKSRTIRGLATKPGKCSRYRHLKRLDVVSAFQKQDCAV